jgi:hypothetical protein
MPNNTRVKEITPDKYLNETRRNVEIVRRKRDELNQLLEGLEAAWKAMSGHVLAHATDEEPRNGSLVATVKEILDAQTEPVPVDVIMDELHKRHIEMDRPNLSSKLHYLKSKGLAKNTDRGKWQVMTSKAA